MTLIHKALLFLKKMMDIRESCLRPYHFHKQGATGKLFFFSVVLEGYTG
jgi:hypothetical protein